MSICCVILCTWNPWLTRGNSWFETIYNTESIHSSINKCFFLFFPNDTCPSDPRLQENIIWPDPPEQSPCYDTLLSGWFAGGLCIKSITFLTDKKKKERKKKWQQDVIDSSCQDAWVPMSHLAFFPSLLRAADVQYWAGTDIEASDNVSWITVVPYNSTRLNDVRVLLEQIWMEKNIYALMSLTSRHVKESFWGNGMKIIMSNGVSCFHQSIRAGADKYPSLLQSHLTQEWMTIATFPTEDKSRVLVGFVVALKPTC